MNTKNIISATLVFPLTGIYYPIFTIIKYL